MTLWLGDGERQGILPYYILSHFIHAYFLSRVQILKIMF